MAGWNLSQNLDPEVYSYVLGLQRNVVYVLTNSALVYESKCGGGELRGLSQ